MFEPAGRAGTTIDFLAGGGECGELLRRRDWSQTSLGPPEDWPLSLRTCLRIILTSRQPMFIWWGDELINLYNDAYKSIVRGKHPWALGAPASDVWREIWDQVAPRARTAMLSNEGTYDEALLLIMERNGYPEETYYTFSYSPVPNDEGGTGGIICANTDDTSRIIGERQLALLRAVAAQTADARTIVDACNLAAQGLATDPQDLPFALIYLIDTERSTAMLAGKSGFADGHPALLERIPLDHTSIWPVGEVARTHREMLIRDLSQIEELPCGAWDRPPQYGVALPIAPSGETGKAGVLVVGLNPFRLYDDNYRRFLELLASQIAASVASAQAYEDERKRSEALAELDRAKTAFFSNVSHEFRTPLTLMLGPMEELLSKAESGEAGDREQLEIMYRNGRRLLRLVNTLLDFSRIEAGRVQASYEPVDLAEYTADLASVFRSAVEKAGMQLVIDTPPLPQPVYVDRDMWEKIVLNLVSNAFKYTLAGEIEVSLRATSEAAELRVRDTGIGIPEEELPRLFDRFHRVQGAEGRTHEGTGIGLALVQELAKLHGGTVSADSRVGEGTTFTVTIPFGTEHLPLDRIQAPRTNASTAVGASSYVDEAMRWLPEGQVSSDTPAERADENAEPRPRIILADDNADMRGYVERLLTGSYEVVTAADGAEALQLAREEVPDLILTDVMMPNLDGFGLLQALRDDTRTAQVPVIMLSARAGEEARVEGLSAGADDYLVKPFSARELFARVAGLLSLSRARREAGETMREMFERSPTIFAVLRGSEYVFEFANPKYHELVGTTRSIIGRTIREALPEIEKQGFIELLDSVYLTGKPFVGNEVCVTLERDGKLDDVYVDFVYEPLRERGGRINGVFVHGVDVTAKVRARNALQEQGRHTKAITDNVTSALLMIDESGCPTFMNPAAEELTGYRLDEIEAQPIHDTLHHHHPDGRPYPMTECPVMASAQRMGVLRNHRDAIVRRDGSFVPVSLSLVPLDGERRTAVVELRDISIELRAEQTMKEDARRKDEFIATLSHELRTPLTAILGWTSMLKLGIDPPMQKTALDTIEQSGRMQAELIDDILDISRISAGKMRIVPQHVNVADVCAAAVEGVRLAATAKELQLDLDTADGEPPVILGDANRLQQIVWNLLTNAIKFTPPGGRVSVGVVTGARDVVVRVTDTGVGIDAAFLPHVFEIFRQAEHAATRAHGGLGLGLSIVRHLVEAHGGRITVESDGAGRGATFNVVFPRLGPIAVSGAQPPGAKQQARANHAGPATLNDIDVLIVDDQQSVRDYFTVALQYAGAKTRTASSVREAVQEITESLPQAIVCDLAMPEEDGFTFIAWLRAQNFDRVPAIAITALGRADDRQRALDAGFDEFLSKPVSPEELSGAVARVAARN